MCDIWKQRCSTSRNDFLLVFIHQIYHLVLSALFWICTNTSLCLLPAVNGKAAICKWHLHQIFKPTKTCVEHCTALYTIFRMLVFISTNPKWQSESMVLISIFCSFALFSLSIYINIIRQRCAVTFSVNITSNFSLSVCMRSQLLMWWRLRKEIVLGTESIANITIHYTLCAFVFPAKIANHWWEREAGGIQFHS